MLGEPYSKANKDQAISSKPHDFAARLHEERVRIEPHQGKFAKRIGISQQKQSFLEKGTRDLRADYLASVANAGIDIYYVLTGRRLNAEPLEGAAAELLSDFLRLPEQMQQLARSIIRTMRDQSSEDPERRSLHAPQAEYRAGTSGKG